MIKNFKNELRLVNLNDNISEKTMTFVLYNELYNNILSHLNNYFNEHYLILMKDTFVLAIDFLKLKDDITFNAEEFIKIYINILKSNRLSNLPKIKQIIEMFEKELNTYIKISEYANVVEKYKISLDTKVNIMANFREYINNMFVSSIKFYGEERSKNIRHNILKMLSSKLEEYLNECVDKDLSEEKIIRNLKPTMMILTKDYLINQFTNGANFFMDFEKDFDNQVFDKFNEFEQKIWLFCIIYNIAGYDKNDKSTIKEICEMLGISKFKLKKTIISMEIRYFKLLKDKSVHEIFDEELMIKKL